MDEQPPQRPDRLQLTGMRLQLTGVRIAEQPPRRPLTPRTAIALGALLVVMVAVAILSISTSPSRLALKMTVEAGTASARLPSGFAGFSVEYQALPAYAGTDPKHPDPVFVSMIRALTAGHRAVLRVGGDSTDHTWWPVGGTTEPPGVSYTLTPTWVAVAKAVAHRAHAKLILGINLAAGNATLAAAEGRALVDRIGRSHIAALEIGNEPDIYTSAVWYRAADGKLIYARSGADWNPTTYAAQFSSWRNVLPDVPSAGPAYAKTVWIRQLSTFLAAEPGLGLVTDHRYPLRNCKGGSGPGDAPSPTVARILDNASAAGLAAALAPAVSAARAAGIPFRLDEINSASCQGRAGVSNTFASALWILDALFQLAKLGVSGINVHTLPGAAYAPFSFSDTSTGWVGHVNPLYYGMLTFARAFPAGATLMPVQLPAGAVKGWATRARNGRVRVVLINKGATPATVTVSLPSGVAERLYVQRLTAPSITSTTGVSLGGRTFGAKHDKRPPARAASRPDPRASGSLHGRGPGLQRRPAEQLSPAWWHPNGGARIRALHPCPVQLAV